MGDRSGLKVDGAVSSQLADVADTFLVFAWSDLEKKRSRDPSGISAFIVERSMPGFSSGTLKEKWGILAGNTGYFKMEDVEVPEANLVGRPGEGFKIAMFALDQAATRWPPGRPAWCGPAGTRARSTRASEKRSASRSASTSS